MSDLIGKPDDDTTLCGEDELWVCCACGKTSRTRYGFDAAGERTSSAGWDASCMLNAQLFRKDRLIWNGTRTLVREVRS